MYNPSLGPLLARVESLPTLLLWGREDKIIPANAGEVYNRSIAGSEMVAFEECGHRPEIEKSEEFIDLVSRFLAS